MQSIIIILYWMLIKYIVYITFCFKTIQVKWIFEFVFRSPLIQKLTRRQSESMVNRTRINFAQSIFFFIIYPSIFSVYIDTVDFKECDPMLRITTLWFPEYISPLSEIDDVVHNVFLNTQCMGYCDVILIAPYKMCTKY